MLRTPVAMLFVLTPVVGCGVESGSALDDVGDEARAADWSPDAPFRDDIRLAEATLGRPWQPPEEGSVPVVEDCFNGADDAFKKAYQVNKNLQLQSGYFWFFYGDAVEEAAPRPDADMFYFFADWNF